MAIFKIGYSGNIRTQKIGHFLNFDKKMEIFEAVLITEMKTSKVKTLHNTTHCGPLHVPHCQLIYANNKNIKIKHSNIFSSTY